MYCEHIRTKREKEADRQRECSSCIIQHWQTQNPSAGCRKQTVPGGLKERTKCKKKQKT